MTSICETNVASVLSIVDNGTDDESACLRYTTLLLLSCVIDYPDKGKGDAQVPKCL